MLHLVPKCATSATPDVTSFCVLPRYMWYGYQVSGRLEGGNMGKWGGGWVLNRC